MTANMGTVSLGGGGGQDGDENTLNLDSGYACTTWAYTKNCCIVHLKRGEFFGYVNYISLKLFFFKSILQCKYIHIYEYLYILTVRFKFRDRHIVHIYLN